MTQIQDRIRFWFRRNDSEFIEQVERDRDGLTGCTVTAPASTPLLAR